MSNKGLFVTVEGIDCSGKSTAVDHVCNLMKEDEVNFIRTREPGGTAISEMLRAFLFENGNKGLTATAESLLFFAARVQHCEELIIPTITSGTHVICDRYTDSTYAYQGAKGRSEAVSALEQTLFGLDKILYPDHTFLFDISVDTYIKRKTHRGVVKGEEINAFEDRDIEYFEQVLNIYRERAKLYPNRFIVIDAEDTIEGVREQVIDAVFKIGLM